MNITFLSLEQTPPLSVPFRFFFTAPLFGLLASLLLLYDSSAIFSNRWHPSTLALTHLVTLGFITMVMFGAILQLLPVLAASPIPHPIIVSTILHLLLSLGTLSLTGGFLMGSPWLMVCAIIFLGFSFIGFIGFVTYSLIQVKGQSPSIIAMRFALSALAVNVILGIGLGMLFGLGIVLPLPTELTNLHLTWGFIGWIGLLIMGIAFTVVPMFQITPQYPPLLTRWLVPLIFLTLLIWTPLYILAHINKLPTAVPELFMGLIGLGLSLFALVTFNLQVHRLRKLPDVTLNFWRIALIGLLLSIIIWFIGILWSDLTTSPLYPTLLGIFFVAGFALPIIQGMLYKIIPFLIWLHLQNRQLEILEVTSMVKTPNMKQIIPDRLARYQFWMYLIAFGLTIVAVLWNNFVYVAGITLVCSFLFFGYNLYRALWLYQLVNLRINSKVKN